LNDDFLKQNTLNLVVHESNLPQGKGFAPVQWQILEGATRIPICLLEATHPVDSGDIVYRSHFELSGLELYEEIRQKQAQATLNIIKEFLNVYPHYIRQKQEGAETFYPKRGVKDGELDIHRSIYEQFNLLRIGNNEQWPSFFFYKGKKYILKIYSE
jgi:methionyl-tRNA formyltransferase